VGAGKRAWWVNWERKEHQHVRVLIQRLPDHLQGDGRLFLHTFRQLRFRRRHQERRDLAVELGTHLRQRELRGTAIGAVFIWGDRHGPAGLVTYGGDEMLGGGWVLLSDTKDG
jgi:hypothetical protein